MINFFEMQLLFKNQDFVAKDTNQMYKNIFDNAKNDPRIMGIFKKGSSNDYK